MAITLGWTAEQVTLGFLLMMVFYAVVACFSGMIDLAVRPLVENNAALVPKQLVLALPAVKDALGGWSMHGATK